MTRSDFSLPDGRRLAWYEAGEGRPLVLLHGWSMSAAVFAELAQSLAGTFRLLIPDLPGHGHSDPACHVTLSAMAEDLAVWLNAEADRPVCLAGWSLGGMLALELAARSLASIERLILIATTSRFTSAADWSCGLPATQVRALVRNLARRFEATLGEFFLLAFEGEEITPARLRDIREFAVRRGRLPNQAAAIALLALLENQDQRHLLPDIDQPALVLHGRLDRITPVAAGRCLAAALPHGRLVEFGGVGHGPFLSRPDQVVARITEFCQ